MSARSNLLRQISTSFGLDVITYAMMQKRVLPNTVDNDGASQAVAELRLLHLKSKIKGEASNLLGNDRYWIQPQIGKTIARRDRKYYHVSCLEFLCNILVEKVHLLFGRGKYPIAEHHLELACCHFPWEGY